MLIGSVVRMRPALVDDPRPSPRTDHPADAIPVYDRSVEDLIDKKNGTSYGEAVKLVARVERLHEAAGDDGWPPYVADVITRHRAERSLIAKIRDKRRQ